MFAMPLTPTGITFAAYQHRSAQRADTLGKLYIALWVLAAVVAIYDGRFAWDHSSSFTYWESNPLARTLCIHGGMAGLLVAKYVGLAFAACVGGYARCKDHWLAWPFTILVASVHLLLVAQYAQLLAR
jgi:hypothetical protein